MRKPMNVAKVTTVLLAFALSACSDSDDPNPSPDPDAPGMSGPSPDMPMVDTFPRVRFDDCPFELSPEVSALRCGVLDTYENYEETGPDARIIEVAFGILPARATPAAADPVVYFVGGPGGSALAEFAFFGEYQLFVENRDLIMVDQRGAGFSNPQLRCEESIFEPELARPCVEAFEQQGVDLSQYRSRVIAEDFKVLREALEIEQWNVYGESYGPIPGIMYADMDPEGIRSIIFDSSTDNQVDIALADAAVPLDYITELAEQCATESDCAARLPDLRNLFIDNFRSLMNDPWQVELPSAEMIELNGFNLFEIMLDVGPIFSAGILEMFVNRDTALFLELVRMSNDGDDNNVPEEFTIREFSNLMHTTVQCAAIDAENYPTAIIPTREPWPDDFLQAARESVRYPSVCTNGLVSIEQDLVQRNPISVSLPSLIVGGALDDAVSLLQLQKFAESFESGTLAVLPKGGHGVYFPAANACIESIVTTFIDNPEQAPDIACLTMDIEPFKFGEDLFDIFRSRRTSG